MYSLLPFPLIYDLLHNPIGLWIFKFGFIISGLWFIPNAMNIVHRLAEFSRILGSITGFLFVLSGIGMIIVALSPVRVSYPMHILGAILGFGGLILGIFLCFILLFVKLKREFDIRSLLISLLFYGPFFVVVVLGIINAGIPELQSLAAGVPFGDFVPEGWEYYEWGAFIFGLITVIGTHFLYLPKK
jgi:hypothetical protein